MDVNDGDLSTRCLFHTNSLSSLFAVVPPRAVPVVQLAWGSSSSDSVRQSFVVGFADGVLVVGTAAPDAASRMTKTIDTGVVSEICSLETVKCNLSRKKY